MPLQGKVALITGAARGQGRSHALRLAEQGVDIIAVDYCTDIGSSSYSMATPADLDETSAAINDLGARVVTGRVDVRVREDLEKVVTDGITELGGIDIVLANAGISAMQPAEKPEAWDDVIGINLTGVFNTVEVAKRALIDQGRGGSVVLTGSTAALTNGYGATPSALAYSAAKHGVVGLMRAYAQNLGRYSIRVNAVHPSAVDTVMAREPALQEYIRGIREHVPGSSNSLPISILSADDITDAVMFLVSDAAKYITGVNLPVDAGYAN